THGGAPGGPPPPPPPRGLAAAGLRPLADRQRDDQLLYDLRAPGPPRRPPRRPCGGPLLPGHRRSGAGPAQPGVAVAPDRVAALAPLAPVGLDHRGHPPGLGPGGAGGARTVGPATA